VRRISLISFSFGFQCSSSLGSSTPGNFRRPATDEVPGTCLLAQTAKLVYVVPVDGGRCRNADHPGVQPGAQVKPHRVWMVANEPRRHLIKLFGPECDVEDEILVYLQLLEVVIELADNLISRSVGEDRLRQAVVERPAVQRQKQAVFNRCEGWKRGGRKAAVSDPDSPESVVLVVLQIIVLIARCSVGGVRIDVIFAGFFYNPSRRLVIVVARPYVAAERGFLFLKPGVATKC
jgi:hypothetical protein